jgi:multicomponent Na+:H+ antiporter subunit C
MEIVLAFVIGILTAAGVYMLMRRSMVKMILGLALLGHAVNLLIFTVGRLTRDAAPLIPEGATELLEPYSDPLPQALILTAIVIGFGVQAFALVLLKRAYALSSVDDFDQLSTMEE